MEINEAFAKCLRSPSVLSVVHTIGRISEEIKELLQNAEVGKLRYNNSLEQSLRCVKAERRHAKGDDLGYLYATYVLQQYHITLAFGGEMCFGIKELMIPTNTGNVVLKTREIEAVLPFVAAWRPQNTILWLGLALVTETHRPEINPKNFAPAR